MRGITFTSSVNVYYYEELSFSRCDAILIPFKILESLASDKFLESVASGTTKTTITSQYLKTTAQFGSYITHSLNKEYCVSCEYPVVIGSPVE
jgi:hypothetical protein